MRMLKFMTLSALLSFTAPALADRVYQFEDDNGLVSTLHGLTPERALDRTEALQAELEAQCESLQEAQEQGKMTPGRMLLAAIMPGGFLFAAFTRQRAAEAEVALEALSGELAELQTDVDYWRALNGAPLLAMAD